MRDALLKLWIRFHDDDRGVTLVEYGIALTLAVAVGTAALTNLGASVSAYMAKAGALMP